MKNYNIIYQERVSDIAVEIRVVNDSSNEGQVFVTELA